MGIETNTYEAGGDDFVEDEPTRGGPGFGHFYTLLGLLVVVIAGAAFMFYSMNRQFEDLRDSISDHETKAAEELALQVRELGARLDGLKAGLDETNGALKGLSAQHDATRKQFMAYKTDADSRLSELSGGLEDQAKALETLSTELDGKIQTAKTELSEKHENMKTTVTQLNDDSQYIISELGKKAEKAYLKFMERKLKKQIVEVSDQVTEVKGELEEKIASTQQRIETVATEMGATLDTRIEKKVEEHVKIDFVPSATEGD